MPCLQVVVVLSGSMEPGFYRGDILFLNLGTAPIRVGEVVVFNIDGRDVPIVHRVVKVHERLPGGEIDILTKVGGSLVCFYLVRLARWQRCLKIVDHVRQHTGMLHLLRLCVGTSRRLQGKRPLCMQVHACRHCCQCLLPELAARPGTCWQGFAFVNVSAVGVSASWRLTTVTEPMG